MGMSIHQVHTLERKGPQQARENTRLLAGGWSRCLKDAVAAAATDMWADGDPRHYCRVIARRLGTDAADVDRILAGLFLEQEREAHTYDQIVRNAPGMAREAGESVWAA